MSMNDTPLRKPEWLRKKVQFGDQKETLDILKDLNLNTVCQEARCPNIRECFCQKQATFLILGPICTRMCQFCNITKGVPEALDKSEPENVAEAVRKLGLRHVVVTSSTRDDLPDGGSEQFVRCVEAIKAVDETITVELLIPDFKGDYQALKRVAESGADIVGHNMETVKRLYHVREGADYQRSLTVLGTLEKLGATTKSAIMLGMGEEKSEVYTLLWDLIEYGCKNISIGQYLAPSKAHYPVQQYIPPRRFRAYERIAYNMGFNYAMSGPYVRSSYMAHEFIEEGNKRGENS